ncbi:MAG: hypothetical protein ACT4NL_13570 [Pseudomarimonas sp.]
MNGMDDNGLDLEALRGRWKESQQPVTAALTLDRAAVAKALAGRTTRAFRRHSFWLLPQIVMAAAALAGLLWFTLNHWQDSIYLLAGAAFTVIAAAELIVDAWQWRVLSTLDFSKPTLMVQDTLARLRARRLAVTKWIMLSSVLLWLPAIAVLLKALTGVDLLRRLDSSVVLINLLIGVLFIPLAILIWRFAMRRFVGDTGMQRFLDEAVGMSWTRAQREWQRQQRSEQTLDDGIDPLAPLPAPLAAALRGLRLRLLLGCLVCAALILSIGLFNASHGGQWQFLVPGICLNLACVSQLVLRILQRLHLTRIDGGMSTQVRQQYLEDAAAMGDKVAKVTSIMSPMLLVLFAQVVAKVSLGTDLIMRVGLPISALIGIAAAILSAQLWRAASRDPDGFVSPLIGRLLGGATFSIRKIRSELG